MLLWPASLAQVLGVCPNQSRTTSATTLAAIAYPAADIIGCSIDALFNNAERAVLLPTPPLPEHRESHAAPTTETALADTGAPP
jgi:hypothetical protein